MQAAYPKVGLADAAALPVRPALRAGAVLDPGVALLMLLASEVQAPGSAEHYRSDMARIADPGSYPYRVQIHPSLEGQLSAVVSRDR